MKKFLIGLFVILTTITANASHLLGGYIQVIQVGTSDTLNVSAVLFSDPQGIGLPQTLILNEYKLVNGFYQTTSNVSMTQTTTGTWQGVNVAMWSATIIRTAGDYRWIYTNCCRGIHTNASSAMNSNFTMGLDYQKSSVPNTSPILMNFLPVNWVVGDTAQSILFAVDPDGDSVVVEMDDALNQYANGTFVPLSPFSQLGNYGMYNVDTDGTIEWSPSQLGQFATGFKVSEYRNGSLIGVNRIQQVFLTQNGSTPNIVNFNPLIQVDLLNGDSTYYATMISNATSTELIMPGVSVTQMSNSTWSLDSLQVGTYKGVLRATSNSSNMDFYVNLVVTSTIGIEEIVKYQSTSYRVYDWNGKFIGTDLRGLRGLYIVRYNNGKSEKIFIQ
jgi:hypothetical protein